LAGFLQVARLRKYEALDIQHGAGWSRFQDDMTDHVAPANDLIDSPLTAREHAEARLLPTQMMLIITLTSEAGRTRTS
jgi:hypothetical protein